MLWIREAEVFPWFDHGTAGKRCRDLDLYGISGDVRGEDQEAPPPSFCPYFGLAVCMATARLSLEASQETLPS